MVMSLLPSNASDPACRVALLVGDGIDGEAMRAVHRALTHQGVRPSFVGPRLGIVRCSGGEAISVDIRLEGASALGWDALVVPQGDIGLATLLQTDAATRFVADGHRSGKPLLVLGGGATMVEAAGIPVLQEDGDARPGLFVHPTGTATLESTVARFVGAVRAGIA